MNRQETEILKKEIEDQMPADFRTGAICEREDGSCAFGLFYDPHGDAITAVCFIAISSPTQWDILKKFAWCSIMLARLDTL